MEDDRAAAPRTATRSSFLVGDFPATDSGGSQFLSKLLTPKRLEERSRWPRVIYQLLRSSDKKPSARATRAVSA